MDLFRYSYAYCLTLETHPSLVFPDCQIMTLRNLLRNSLLTLIGRDSRPWFPPMAYILPSRLRQDANACYHQRAAPVTVLGVVTGVSGRRGKAPPLVGC